MPVKGAASVSVSVTTLGEFSLNIGDIRVEDLARMPTVLLALLASEPDKLVSRETLMAELWPQDKTSAGTNTLQCYILQIRRAIGMALAAGGSRLDPKKVLATHPAGYRLHANGGKIDFQVFDTEVRLGRQALRAGAVETAGKHFSQAITIWRGTPLVGVAKGPRLNALVARLEEERLSAIEALVDCEMRRGRYQDLLPLLAECVVTYSENEFLCAKYMWALHRAGRRAEAKRAYDQLALNLQAHGLSPAPHVKRLYRSICEGDERTGSEARQPVITERLATTSWQLG